MSDQAAIFANKKVFKINGLINLSYSIDGFVLGFTITKNIEGVNQNVVYKHFIEDDVIKTSKAFQQKISRGYYNETLYLLYREKKNAKSFNDFITTKYENFISATDGDIVKVEKIKLKSPYTQPDNFGQLLFYDLEYKNGTSLLDESDSIIVPSSGVTEHNINLVEEARIFYFTNISHVNISTDPKEKYNIAFIIANIAIDIHNINLQIFPLFNNDPTSSQIINNQNTYWKSLGGIFSNPTIEDLNKYRDGTSKFFWSAYRNQNNIRDAVGIDKLYSLVIGMSINALSILTAESKLELLQFIVKNVTIRQSLLFFNDNEDLVLRIVKAVLPNQADVFLNGMIDKTRYSSINKWNLFNRLLNDVDDSFVGIGDDNKKDLVMSLYIVWQFSSYNPYQNGTFSQSNLDNFVYNDELGTNPDPSNSIFEDLMGIDSQQLNFNAAPITLNYVSNSGFGFYFDNFDFYNTTPGIEGESFGYDMRFFGNADDYPPNKILAVQDNYRASGDSGLYGTYDFYQPVSLINANQNAAINIPVVNSDSPPNQNDINSLIPVFVLKYIDGKNKENNFNTGVGYFIDIASLSIGGYGLLTKIKHLRQLSGFGPIIAGTESGANVIARMYVAAGLEAINFTSASISLYLKIITDHQNENSPWLKKMKNLVMWLEILSGTSSFLAEKMVRKASKNLVNDFNNNGWPDEFTTDTRGAVASEVLEDASGLVVDFYNAAKNKIKQNINKRISNQSSLFTLNFNNSQLDDLMQIGLENNLPIDEIEGIIFSSCRNSKPKNFADTIDRLENWSSTIKPRGYSYKFNSLATQNVFGTSLKSKLNARGIPNNDVRIQGSSLLTSSAGDTDIAIIINKDQIGEIKKLFHDSYKKEFLDPSGLPNTDKIKEQLEKLEKAINEGIIKFPLFGKKNGKSFVQELYPPYPNGEKLNISIIIKEGRFDYPPYIKL
jgi:hypothetical protein